MKGREERRGGKRRAFAVAEGKRKGSEKEEKGGKRKEGKGIKERERDERRGRKGESLQHQSQQPQRAYQKKK